MADKRCRIYHNLSILLDSGLPILRALRTAGSGLRGKVPRILTSMEKSIANGSTLAESMQEHPKTFCAMDILIVEAGETSGRLCESLDMLGKWYEFKSRIRRVILSGLPLPILLIHAVAMVAPLPSVFLGGVGMAGYLGQALAILSLFYIPVGVILAVVYLTPASGPLRSMLDTVVMGIPILGRAVRHLDLSRYCRAFYMLYEAGVPILDCARSATGVVGNSVIRNMLKGGIASVSQGQLMSEGFSEKLPADFINLWQMGEETGDLDKITLKLAQNSAETCEMIFIELAKWMPRLAYFFVSAIIVVMIFKGYGQIYSAF